MKATVKYNDDHERYSIDVNASQEVGLEARFSLNGGIAALTSITQNENADTRIYGDNINLIMGYVAGLPFVEDVVLDSYDELPE